jgi:hypothetical protein
MSPKGQLLWNVSFVQLSGFFPRGLHELCQGIMDSKGLTSFFG